MEASQDRCSLICCRFLPQKHKWMKKFVLHCTRYTEVTQLFNVNFVHIKKEGTLGTRLISKKKFFLSESANFSASERLEKNFPILQNGLEKMKNLYLIKLVSKWKRAIRKGHTNFFLFHFWDLILVPIDTALNSASDNLTHFFQYRHGTKKSSKTWKF